jgi:hypothetical protein
MTEEVDAVYGDIHMVKDDDLTRCVRYYSSGGFKKWMFRIGLAPAHPSFYCRSEIYHRLGYYDSTYKIGADYECLIRFIYKNRICAKYLSMDFVTMRMGGVSNSGWSSISIGYKDRLRALRSNGINANPLLLCLMYPFKYWGVIRSYKFLNTI